MTSLVLSFLTVIAIPVMVILSIAGVSVTLLRRPWPSTRKLLADIAISVLITVGITFGISLVLSWTGFFHSQFYRPSAREFDEPQKLGLETEDRFFKSQDGTELHGWFLPATSTAKGTVIHFHGSDRNISFTVRNGEWLRSRGFNVFVFDYRGYGKSKGTPSRQGTVEDGIAAIEYVRTLPEVDPERICLWGESMGGQLAIVAAEMTGAKGVKAIVSEATYSSYSHHIKDKMSGFGPLWLVQWGAWLVTSDAFAAEDRVAKIGSTQKLQILFVHGTLDNVVAPYHSERLFTLANEPKEIWRIEGARHLDVFRTEPNRTKLVEYLTRACGSSEQ